jgi:D-sedoheptulose 7-phosphate isomerase
MKNIKFFKEFFVRYPRLKYIRNNLKFFLEILIKHFKNKNYLFVIGNGGSSSDSDHISGELLKGFLLPRNLKRSVFLNMGSDIVNNLQHALPVIPLTGFSAFNTAFGNDCSFNYAFAQLVWALCNKNDLLLCISTSGNSKNILNSAKVASFKGLTVISLTNYLGGSIKNYSNLNINVPEIQTFKTQEIHLPIYHIISILVEESFFGSVYK